MGWRDDDGPLAGDAAAIPELELVVDDSGRSRFVFAGGVGPPDICRS